MSDIYTGIDLGTDSVKVVVCEKLNDKYHVLASSSYPSSGIKDGFITDNRMAINSVSNAIRQVNEMLGIKITKVIACVPPANCSMDIVVGKVDVIDYNEITGIDIGKNEEKKEAYKNIAKEMLKSNMPMKDIIK